MIIIWAPSDRPSLGIDMSAEDAQYEKEYWRVKTSLRYVAVEKLFSQLNARIQMHQPGSL